MTFDELHLACAIEGVRSRWGGRELHTKARRLQLAKLVFEEWVLLYGDTCFPFTVDKIAEMYTNRRKKGYCEPSVAEIAKAHGQFKCFWEKRGKGACSDDAEAGHIMPRANGHALTIENGIVECGRHNRERKTQSIEQYLRGDCSQ